MITRLYLYFLHEFIVTFLTLPLSYISLVFMKHIMIGFLKHNEHPPKATSKQRSRMLWHVRKAFINLIYPNMRAMSLPKKTGLWKGLKEILKIKLVCLVVSIPWHQLELFHASIHSVSSDVLRFHTEVKVLLLWKHSLMNLTPIPKWL